MLKISRALLLSSTWRARRKYKKVDSAIPHLAPVEVGRSSIVIKKSNEVAGCVSWGVLISRNIFTNTLTNVTAQLALRSTMSVRAHITIQANIKTASWGD